MPKEAIPLEDDAFLRAFLKGWPVDEHFGHYDHLRAAWLVIDHHGAELAPEIVGDRLRQMAVAVGKAPLYNETMTRFWIRLIAHVRDATKATTIDEAIAQVPFLLDKHLAQRHWSRSLMFGPEARERWVEPDLLPLSF